MKYDFHGNYYINAVICEKKKKKKLKTNFDLQKLTDKTNGNAPQR